MTVWSEVHHRERLQSAPKTFTFLEAARVICHQSSFARSNSRCFEARAGRVLFPPGRFYADALTKSHPCCIAVASLYK